MNFVETNCDVFDGSSESDDSVTTFCCTAGLGAKSHCADSDRGSDHGCCDLDH